MDRLNKNELIPLYLLLSEKEDQLDVHLRGLLRRVEDYLFDKLSIEEMESLGRMQRAEIDALARKL